MERLYDIEELMIKFIALILINDFRLNRILWHLNKFQFWNLKQNQKNNGQNIFEFSSICKNSKTTKPLKVQNIFYFSHIQRTKQNTNKTWDSLTNYQHVNFLEPSSSSITDLSLNFNHLINLTRQLINHYLTHDP